MKKRRNIGERTPAGPGKQRQIAHQSAGQGRKHLQKKRCSRDSRDSALFSRFHHQCFRPRRLPIASLTWWLLPKAAASDAKRAALAGLLGWMLTSGQENCSALGYVPLPREIAAGELELLRTLK